jgi:2,3-dihydroxyphenylpropionate 1,2-dioxygenase
MSEKRGIVGGVCMAHAPQFFTLPDTEDRNTVERVRQLAARNGEKLKALDPDVTLVVANDHANQFLLHCVPSFAIHRGKEASGHFAGRDFRFDVDSDTATDLVRYLQDEKFDPAFTSTAELDYAFGIPLTFLKMTGPIIPIYVNAYVPPQPRMERCYHLGQAIDRALRAMDKRAVVVASGGLSHFPGTDRYDRPATDFDLKLIREMSAGNLRWLLSLDEKRLDDTGNIELRC